jgi:hypothetical protein
MMAGIRVAVQQAPRRVKVTDSDALLEHAKILQLRSRLHDVIDQAMRPAEQRVEEAKLRLRQAEVAAEQVKLEVDTIALQERKAVESFYAATRKATPQVRALLERYGGDVSLSFDSNGRSVWVMALFGEDAPPALRTVSASEVPWIPVDEEQAEDGNDEESKD